MEPLRRVYTRLRFVVARLRSHSIVSSMCQRNSEMALAVHSRDDTGADLVVGIWG